jgi:hypothetical protein
MTKLVPGHGATPHAPPKNAVNHHADLQRLGCKTNKTGPVKGPHSLRHHLPNRKLGGRRPEQLGRQKHEAYPGLRAESRTFPVSHVIRHQSTRGGRTWSLQVDTDPEPHTFRRNRRGKAATTYSLPPSGKSAASSRLTATHLKSNKIDPLPANKVPSSRRCCLGFSTDFFLPFAPVCHCTLNPPFLPFLASAPR